MWQKMLTVGTIFFVGFLHVPAVRGDWYFFLWWYDVMMHVLGGVAMGMLGFCVWQFLAPLRFSKNNVRYWMLGLLSVLGFVALVGISWEWFEALVDALLLPQLGVGNAQLGLTDTMLDLYFDLFGGVIGFSLFSFLMLYGYTGTSSKRSS